MKKSRTEAHSGEVRLLRSNAAVIPCFNEALTISGLVRDVRRYIADVVVVDDGSVDDTGRLAAEAGALVCRHPCNLGKGAALQTGLAAAIQQGHDWALMLDGDGQHLPENIPAFLQTAATTGAKLVIGDRMHHAMAMPWLRRWVNRWMSRRISRRQGRYLPDTQCGFRLLDLKIWATLKCDTQHYEMESEMLMAFLDAGCRVDFVPIQVVGRGACSHIHPLIDTWRWLKWWGRLPVRRSRLPLGPLRPEMRHESS